MRLHPARRRRRGFLERFRDAVSPGFDPDVDLGRIGLANQTTMLMSESLEIGEMFREAMRDRFGERALPQRYRAFDTICSATQDRQDAVLGCWPNERLDLMMVIGGYNSSNTCNLAHICAEQRADLPHRRSGVPDLTDVIRHKPVVARPETSSGWLPASGLRVGLTSGASTPDNLVGGCHPAARGAGPAPPDRPRTAQNLPL